MHNSSWKLTARPSPRRALLLLLLVALLAGCGSASRANTSAVAPTVAAPSTTATPGAIAAPSPAAPRPHATSVPTPTPPGQGAAYPWRRGLIAFSLELGGRFHIYTARADGTQPKEITDTSGGDYTPVWSPDGARILFVSHRDEPNPALCDKIALNGNAPCNSNIYVMDADGSNQIRLTDNPTADNQPTWSPDGSRIAFRSLRGDYANIYVMDADGGNRAQLTADRQQPERPAWSPDGSQIAYSALSPVAHDIFVIQTDGTKKTRLTRDPGYDITPAWSPDGAQIAFASNRSGTFRLYSMDADDGNVQPLSDAEVVPWFPLTWSPDGTHIAFVSRVTGHCEIAALDLETGEITPVTHHQTCATSPSWAPASVLAPERLDEQPVLSTRATLVLHEPRAEAYVLDRLGAGERVEPLLRSNDGGWVFIKDSRAVLGWVERASLSASDAQLEPLDPIDFRPELALPPVGSLAPLIPFDEPALHLRGLRPEGWTTRESDQAFQIQSAPGAQDMFFAGYVPLDDRSAAAVDRAGASVIHLLLNGREPEQHLAVEVIHEERNPDGTRSVMASYTQQVQGTRMVAVRVRIYLWTRLRPQGLLVAGAYVPEAQFDDIQPLFVQMVDSVEASE